MASGAAREAARRRQGVGGALRRARQNAQERSRETATDRAAREQRELANRPADRFAFGRLIDGYPAARAPPQPRDRWQEAVAVYAVIGWRERDGDPLTHADWAPELLKNRYIRLWVFRHGHLAAETLIATLADAVDTARDHDCGVVLPELPPAPVAEAPPVRRASPTRPEQPPRPGSHRGHPGD